MGIEDLIYFDVLSPVSEPEGEVVASETERFARALKACIEANPGIPIRCWVLGAGEGREVQIAGSVCDRLCKEGLLPDYCVVATEYFLRDLPRLRLKFKLNTDLRSKVAVLSETEWKNTQIKRSFNLIWIGSSFAHYPGSEQNRMLGLVMNLLFRNGRLLFSNSKALSGIQRRMEGIGGFNGND